MQSKYFQRLDVTYIHLFMKKAFLTLILAGLGFMAKAQQEGQIKLHVQTSQVAPQLSSFLSVEKGLTPFLNQLNATYAPEHDIPVLICDCGVENAFYTPSIRQITICYEWLDQHLKLLTQKTGTKDYVHKVQGIVLVPLLQELGNALLHQLNYPLDGKEAQAVDEFAVVSLAANPGHEYFWPLHYGLLAKYHRTQALSAKKQSPVRANEQLAATYAPDLARYYRLRSILSGAYPDLALQEGTIGDNRAPKNRHKLDETRFESSSDEYQRIARQWENRLAALSRQQKTLPLQALSMASEEEVEKPESITIPIYRLTSLEMEHWRIKSHPLHEIPFLSAKREPGRRVYDVRVNAQGELVSASANPGLARGRCPVATEAVIHQFVNALKFEQTTQVPPANHSGRIVVEF